MQNATISAAASLGARSGAAEFCVARQLPCPGRWLAGLTAFTWLLFVAPAAFGGPGPETFGHYGTPQYQTPPASGDTARSDYWFEWAALRVGTDRLLQNLGATNADASRLLYQIQTNAQFLQDRWNAWFDAHANQRAYAPADRYLDSLRDDNWLLGGLRKEKDQTKAIAKLRDVALDMQLKADNCRNSKDGLGKEIKVRVHTKSGGQEIGGYEVYFSSKGMFEIKSAHDRFPRQSSPTDEKILCPGGYMIWASKHGFTSPPVALGIGGHGETQVDVDIDVSAN
jgi:hypothetical protein